jgi:hypothetical protein
MRLRRSPFSVRAIARIVAISESVPLRERYSRSAAAAWRYASRASASPPSRSRASALIAPVTQAATDPIAAIAVTPSARQPRNTRKPRMPPRSSRRARRKA